MFAGKILVQLLLEPIWFRSDSGRRCMGDIRQRPSTVQEVISVIDSSREMSIPCCADDDDKLAEDGELEFQA